MRGPLPPRLTVGTPPKMAKLISPDSISFRATVTEDEIRQRMSDEVLEQINGMGADGKPRPGISVKVMRGESRKGGYSIEVSGPVPARIFLPPPGGIDD
jgi:hypothetical protein